MIIIFRPLVLALVAALTLFVMQAIGEDVDFGDVYEILKSDRGKLEEMDSAVSIIKMADVVDACEKFRVAIDGFQFRSGSEGERKVDNMFDSAFAAIDAAEGDHARKGANLAFDLAKGLGANGGNPWYWEAGFRVIYANVCK